jgi:hypothetical protein
MLIWPPETKTADRAAATARSAALVPFLTGCPTARATWGDVCSPARRISVFDESECLYETCFCRLGFLICPFEVVSVITVHHFCHRAML